MTETPFSGAVESNSTRNEHIATTPMPADWSARNNGKRGFARADWIILPLLGALTILLLSASAELVAGRMFPILDQTLTTCLVFNDPSTGVRGIPNSVCVYKRAEHSINEYKFNNCGHPMDTPCGPKPPGVYRIVLVGSSYPFGLGVPRDKSFAALLPAQLSQKTGRNIALYNESMYWGIPNSVALRFKEALAVHPNMILWVLTAWDVEQALHTLPPGGRADVPERTFKRVVEALSRASLSDVLHILADRAHARLSASKSGFLLQHFFYESQTEYMKSYLAGGDRAGFLLAEPNTEWQQRLQRVDIDAANMETQARAAGVPFVAVLVPNRAHAAMISMGHWPAGYNPYKFNDDLRAIITAHGGDYIDILPGFRTIANPEQHYFPVDDHPDARGHAILAELLTKALTSGAVPELSSVSKTQAALQPTR